MVYTVVFSAAAGVQLSEIYSYIADHAGTALAEAFVGGITTYCQSFAEFPHRGTQRDDILPGLRTVGYKRRVTIAFIVDQAGQTVVIHGIFYGGRDYIRHLLEPES